MTIRFSKQFIKQLSKQPAKVEQAFYTRLRLFQENPNEPLLRNHALHGKLEGYYSINVTGDVRALYEIVNGEMYLYQLIGTHSQLYK